MSWSIYVMSEEYGESEAQFPSFQHAFETVFRMAKNRRLVFVIDEYPYLAECSKGIASILQKLIDANKDSSKLFLILCGSSMSFMEKLALLYGITGGIPLYVSMMDKNSSVEENIKTNKSRLSWISLLFQMTEARCSESASG